MMVSGMLKLDISHGECTIDEVKLNKCGASETILISLARTSHEADVEEEHGLSSVR